MNIVTVAKIVCDDQDIQIASDRTLDYSKARPTVSTYDLNAIEAGSLVAAEKGATHIVVSAGTPSIDDTKNNKNILARGVDSLTLIMNDDYADLDAKATAEALAPTVKDLAADVVICGDGSADIYAQQVDVQLAEALGLPVVTAVSKISFEGSALVAERILEAEKEVVEIALPAVVSVVPDIALPRICGMRDIMQAGKKPVTKIDGATVVRGAEVMETLAPEPAPRKKMLFDAGTDGDIDKFVAAVAEAIR
ncbi:electron transfer flavoprotein [Adlercreutzia sp. ZJ141]|uniref:electron transfer flavoprotein n=1 Tax=Adlercreutzia sp. ZJ141 TaxID=2709406 RepID=UPI0013EC33BF|nr:electron transfer flavoprotein [Adlercreutzia sp. ZJ141]